MVHISYFKNDSRTAIILKEGKENDMWNSIEYKGKRCYRMKLSQENISYGIKGVKIYFHQYCRLFFHGHGTLETGKTSTIIDIQDKTQINVELEHEAFHMLDFGGQECLNDNTYDRDMCAHEKLFQVKIKINSTNIE